jgi:hypothetical protein
MAMESFAESLLAEIQATGTLAFEHGAWKHSCAIPNRCELAQPEMGISAERSPNNDRCIELDGEPVPESVCKPPRPRGP